MLLGFCVLSTVAQTPFWSETFSDQMAFETNWTTGGTNPGPEDWTWSDDPSPFFNGQPAFASTTASDGSIIFNSDANGDNVHDVRVTSPAIDCSGQDVVILRSEHQYGFFSESNVSIAEVGVSTNGTDFTYYQILTEVPRNDLSDAVQIVQLELPEAANQSEVYLQFRWRGNFEYTWRIDDLSLSNEELIINHDAALVTPLVATNYSTPVSQIDTLSFITALANNGLQTQTNLRTSITIVGDNGDTFAAEQTVEELASGALDTLNFVETFVPSGLGNYLLTYELTQDSMDQFAVDNLFETGFIIDESIFAKDDGLLESATQPLDIDENQTFQMGNYFEIVTDGFLLDEVIFTVASDDNEHQGESVNVFLYQINDNGDASFTDEDVTVIGLGEYTFTDEENFDLVSTPLTNPLDFTNDIPLPIGEYIVMVEYQGNMFCPFSGITYGWDRVASVVRDENEEWFLGGFGEETTAIIRMSIRPMPTNTEQLTLLEGATLEVFPNPANTVATAKIILGEQVDQAQLAVVDLSGKVLETLQLDTLEEQQVELQVGHLPSGNYLLQLLTEKGYRSTKLIIQH